MGDWGRGKIQGDKGEQGDYTKSNKAGYEYLFSYKLSVPIYDYTVIFCQRYIPRYSRTYDQMEQAARSGMQNVPEGNKQQSLSGYIRLAGVSRGSFEELLKDYVSYGRQHAILIWPKERVMSEIGEISEIWRILRATPTLPDNPSFPDLPKDPVATVNLMVTLINQENYLLDKLISSLKEKHKREGGFSEQLYRERREYRDRTVDWGAKVNLGDRVNRGDREEKR